MTESHPITPSPEFIREWQIKIEYTSTRAAREALVTKVFQLGADQELEACLQWFSEFYCMETWMRKDLEKFRAARRPKPPSLKEQALALLDDASDRLDAVHENTIRRALESLPD